MDEQLRNHQALPSVTTPDFTFGALNKYLLGLLLVVIGVMCIGVWLNHRRLTRAAHFQREVRRFNARSQKKAGQITASSLTEPRYHDTDAS